MLKTIVSGMMLALLLMGMLTLAFNIQPVNGSGTIYIRADGSVEGTDKIQRDGDVYTFTDNIRYSIVVERSNIIVDGNGYTLEGPGAGAGFVLGGNGITIKNTVITGFDIPGAYFAHVITSFGTSNNTITGNTIVSNEMGIYLDTVNGYMINGNIIANNKMDAIYMDDSENNDISNNLIKNNEKAIILVDCSNKIYHNDFIDNTNPGFETTTPHGESNNVWDDGYPSGGNYWSDYTGVDADNDGVGDTPYYISAVNPDRYPLMKPISGLKIPTEEGIPTPFWTQWWFYAIVAVAMVVLAGAVYFLKKRKPPTPTPPAS